MFKAALRMVPLVLIASCARTPRTIVVDSGSSPDHGAEGGERLFLESCASCHGTDGEGTSQAPQIRSPVQAYATWVVRHGRVSEMGYPGDMPMLTVDSVSDSDLSSILDWLGRPPRPTTGAYCA